MLLLVALHLGSSSFCQLRFDQEKIEIWVFPQQTQVTGLYHYANHFILPVSFSLGIPFPVDPEHPWPAEFRVSEADANGTFLRDIETHRYHGETVVRLWFWSWQDRWIRLDYVQGAHLPQARYILQTTRKWHHPLDHGEYILHFGDGLELAWSNYPMKRDARSELPTYFFFRMDFLPSEDWQFRWQEKPALMASREPKP